MKKASTGPISDAITNVMPSRHVADESRVLSYQGQRQHQADRRDQETGEDQPPLRMPPGKALGGQDVQEEPSEKDGLARSFTSLNQTVTRM